MTSVYSLRLTTEDSERPEAWLGWWETVRLLSDTPAVRVHVGAGEGAATRPELVAGAGSRGRWYAIGDVTLTRSQYIGSRALPAGFSMIDFCILKAGSIVNIGRCSGLVPHPGGGEQVELLSGPAPERTTSDSAWVDYYGTA